MTDKNALDLARVFAEVVESRPIAYDEQVRAAAEVVVSLPDEWVDADTLRKYISDWREGLATAPRGNYEAEMLDDLEDMLPAPKPRTLADMAPDERAECQWMQADLKGGRIIIGAIADGGVNYIKQDGKAYWDSLGSGAGEIVPLPDLPRMQWPGSEPDDVAAATGGELTTQDVVDECRAVRKERAAAESAAPRPEDVPVGEPWQVEVNGRAAIGCRNDPEDMICWTVVYRDEAGHDWMYDDDVTLIARLVPETTEQDDEEAPSNKEAMGESMADFADRIFGRFPAGEDLCTHVNRTSVEHHQERMRATEFDPAYTYRDLSGDKWAYVYGGWRLGGYAVNRPHSTPPDEWGPYTRIEDTK